MGKLRLKLCTGRGQHHKTVETVLDAGQISLTPLFLSIEWSRNFSMHETPLQCTKYTFLKFTLKDSEVMTLEWVRERCIYQHSPGDCPTGGPEMTDSLPVLSHVSRLLWWKERTTVLPEGSGICIVARHVVALSWLPAFVNNSLTL